MWVTQTYLGDAEPNAKAFVYYFFEDYNEQLPFTQNVQRELEKLGDVYDRNVSLLMPNPKYAGRIEAEVRENPKLWVSLRGNLPGLFLTPVPLAKLTAEQDGCIYIPFLTTDAAGVAEAISAVRRRADDLLYLASSIDGFPDRKSFGDRLLEAIEVKPGIWGFRLDLRKFLQGR